MHKSEITVNVGNETYKFKISFADLFDKIFLQPLKDEIKNNKKRNEKKEEK